MTRIEEVRIKLSRVRNFLDKHGLSAVLLKKQPNFSWITGGGLNMVGIATEIGVASVLITRESCYILANKIESERMKDEELGELNFEIIDYDWFENKELEIVKKIVDGKVGCDVPVSDLNYVENEINKLRYELTESEIERYMYLGEILSRSLESVLLFVKPGDSEASVAGKISEQLWQYRIDPTGFMVAADERARLYRHPIPTLKKIERSVMVSVNARYKGLITTVTRMVYFGKVPADVVTQYRNNVEIECIMIDKTRAGEKMNVPVLAAIEEYKRRGYHEEWKFHHQGGPMGYYARDIRVTPACDEIIRRNQAFCWNPTISGTKSEDGFIVTESGPIMITKPFIFPKLEIGIGNVRFVRPDIFVI
ncbi:MAG TPA: peptidase M24 [Pseudothermotoga sp.]|uniref:M24 family metallopeptidase n=1 Tax=Pseudothermotoga lettingae TaxID=177758 RepID=UPI0007499B44|nr:M24 family metallopeptidase [Pseudothermotoga lettingae]KUK20686.1 MAG: Peptidase M24 [Pseudothermotoga lettingae]HBT25143.1 peptidase M24 [Pseudothermotoga sp.]